MCRRCRVGRHSRDCTSHPHRWRAVSGLLYGKHYVLNRALQCAERSASTVTVGGLCMRWATRCHY